MWQSAYDELKGLDFVVLAVATDSAEAARPWIDAAKAEFPCLIDSTHHVADLYNLVNVPQAAWIDETGSFVRPPETAGSNDGFRQMDRNTGAVPPEVLTERVRLKNVYFDAVRDWARNGARSRHCLSPQEILRRLELPDPSIAQAHALFLLGRHLLALGLADEATRLIAEASRLHPDSWCIWRQSAPRNDRGLASGPQFWARVDALADRPYYKPIDIAGADSAVG